MRTRKKFNGRERGQSLVEFSVSFTFIMLLLAGSVDLSRAFFALIALNDAAQEGSVYAATDPTNNAEIIARVRATSSNPIDLTDTTAVTVPAPVLVDDLGNGEYCAGNGITVSVTYQFVFTMPLINTFITSNSFPLTGTSTATILTPVCP
jgi:Flp pilus assembly protein TadG